MMSLTFGLFTQVSGSGPLGPLVQLFRVNDLKNGHPKRDLRMLLCIRPDVYAV